MATQNDLDLTSQFLAITDKTTAVMRPLLVGPDYISRKYSTDKAAVAVGSYTGSALNAAWPGLLTGEVVDAAFTKVNLDGAAQRYYNSASGSVEVDVTFTNRLVSPSVNWVDKTSFARSVTVPTDVVVGDWVRVTGTEAIVAQVKAIHGDAIVATTDTTPNAGTTNPGTVTGGSSVSTTAGTGTVVSSIAALTNPDNYNGGPGGIIGDTYVITCTTAANAAGNVGTWIGTVLSVYSLSGKDYSAASPQIITVASYATLAAGISIGAFGAAVKLSHGATGDDWVVGTKVEVVVTQTYTFPTVAAAGTYTGTSDTTYLLRVTKGGYFGPASVPGGRQRAEITITTTTGAGIAGAVVQAVTSAAAFALGNYGVTATFTYAGSGLDDLVLGSTWTVPVTAGTSANSAISGALRTLELSQNLAVLSGQTNLLVELAVLEDIEIPKNRTGHAPTVNWTATTSQIQLNSGIISTDPRTGSLELTVVAGTAYATYRALRSTYANTPQEIQLESDIVALGMPSDDVDNVMGYALRRTINGIGGNTIRFVPVATDNLAGYQAALQSVADREDFYNIVPLTTDATSIQAVVDFLATRTTGQAWSGAIVARTIATENAFIKLRSGGGVSTAIIGDDTLATGTQYTLVTDTSGLFVTNLVRAGDVLRAEFVGDGFGNETYASYTVASIESNQILRLTSGTAVPYGVATRYEIWRSLTAAEQVAAFDAQAAVYADSTIKVVLPWVVTRQGVSVPSYHLAATIAARRSGSAPHQSLKNLVLTDWDDMSQSKVTFSGLLSQTAVEHSYVVTQLTTGEVVIKFQHSSAGGSVQYREDSVQNNLDSIQWFYKTMLSSLKGRTNVVDANLSKIRGLVANATNYLKITSTTAELGPQVIDATVISIEQDPILRDNINVVLSLRLPAPLNDFIQTITVTV